MHTLFIQKGKQSPAVGISTT